MEGGVTHEPGLPLLASLDARVEALLAAAPAPVPLHVLAAMLPEGSDLEACLRRIEAFWEGRGVALVRDSAGLTLRARQELLPPDAAAPGRRLSEGAVATLAVIAMHQPIAVPEIEAVRGVKLARGIIESLERAGLVEEGSRRRGTGRARLYATTDAFLDRMGLAALSDLPTPEELRHSEIVAG